MTDNNDENSWTISGKIWSSKNACILVEKYKPYHNSLEVIDIPDKLKNSAWYYITGHYNFSSKEKRTQKEIEEKVLKIKTDTTKYATLLQKHLISGGRAEAANPSEEVLKMYKILFGGDEQRVDTTASKVSLAAAASNIADDDERTSQDESWQKVVPPNEIGVVAANEKMMTTVRRQLLLKEQSEMTKKQWLIAEQLERMKIASQQPGTAATSDSVGTPPSSNLSFRGETGSPQQQPGTESDSSIIAPGPPGTDHWPATANYPSLDHAWFEQCLSELGSSGDHWSFANAPNLNPRPNPN